MTVLNAFRRFRFCNAHLLSCLRFAQNDELFWILSGVALQDDAVILS